jgi:hypothetical protein
MPVANEMPGFRVRPEYPEVADVYSPTTTRDDAQVRPVPLPKSECPIAS